MGPTAWRHWAEAARPKTLPAAVIPVLVGTALAAAHRTADCGKAAICLLFALLVQIGTNFANDYFDFVKGADTPARVGPRRAVAAGLIAPRTMLRATGLVLGVAFLVGLLLVREGGWILLPIGIISIVCAIAYTGGPFPLGYNGLGDLFVFIFFGLVAVDTTFYVQAGGLAPDATSCAAAVGLLAANILVANNYRDAETDARAGKRTLVVRFGRKFAVWQYALSHIVALLCPAALIIHGYRWPVLLPLVLAPWAFGLTRRLAASREPAEQIALLAATAKYLAAFGVLLSAGLILGR
ncbi:1,4-dihydroxy-2-naphthoate polyprenyltransferase [Opitutus sp. GAS368]|jgi:1,4-dihydroxy-2-naphthoate octaprenyltransferase|uniref:1,4-dihydroxy-2-naphthoate polyprenyltransferase n=1 Tax=Opitutus sp. GAS368 TaxID=1882749 RepID=UPI00087B0793|nr:1,4-dihydroxy-2-naphthoate polyprenyltransferase [Opitutus sp. GAS368]SDS64708.1 1,4-dihydroxy-2-naphthoate prenyltransferase [Opitutus sp. GAS368]